MATQATPMKPPRPITKGQVSALFRAMRGQNAACSLAGWTAYDQMEMNNIESLLIASVRDVNDRIGGGVSS